MVLLGFKLLPILYNLMVTGSEVILLTLCPWTGSGMKTGLVVMMDRALDSKLQMTTKMKTTSKMKMTLKIKTT